MKLREARVTKLLSQSELKRRSKVSQSQISQTEHGEPGQLSMDSMRRIAEALGMDVAEIDEFRERIEQLKKHDPVAA